jgi:hypothetical protein
METYALELGDRVVAYLNGGIDRNERDSHYEGYGVYSWGES